MFPVVCCNGLQGLKMDWNLRQQQDTCHTATRSLIWFLYETDSDTESDEEGDFEVVYSKTFMTSHVGNEDQYVTAASGSMRPVSFDGYTT